MCFLSSEALADCWRPPVLSLFLYPWWYNNQWLSAQPEAKSHNALNNKRWPASNDALFSASKNKTLLTTILLVALMLFFFFFLMTKFEHAILNDKKKDDEMLGENKWMLLNYSQKKRNLIIFFFHAQSFVKNISSSKHNSAVPSAPLKGCD